MESNDPTWDFFWEIRLRNMETLGKREAIRAASRIILQNQQRKPLRILELGCGEGQIIGTLVDSHVHECSRGDSLGIDIQQTSIDVCRRNYPGINFLVGDITNRSIMHCLGKFDIVLIVNALHEVFSFSSYNDTEEIDVPAAKNRVGATFKTASDMVIPGGYLILFDGLEPSGDNSRLLKVRFLSTQAREKFDIFCKEYHPFHIAPLWKRDPFTVELSLRDFTRYITKSIFLGKPHWAHEQFESYQYWTESEFRAAFSQENIEIIELRQFTENYEKWVSTVSIISEGEDFPAEHILICGKKLM